MEEMVMTDAAFAADAAAADAAMQELRLPMVTMRGIQKSYGGKPVLKDINLRVFAGDVLAILGPSGSGKSTLLR